MAKYLTSTGLNRVITKIEGIITSVKGELTTAIGTKVTAVEGKDLLSTAEAAKLAKLTVAEDGTLSMDNIPKAAVPTLVTVATEQEMFALTTAQVQNGDSVRIEPADGSTPIMYYVVDETQLTSAAGYKKYAAVTDWSTVANIPAKVVQPQTLKVQVNGTDITSYTGNEEQEVVANITLDSLAIEAVTDEEIDAMFTLAVSDAS